MGFGPTSIFKILTILQTVPLNQALALRHLQDDYMAYQSSCYFFTPTCQRTKNPKLFRISGSFCILGLIYQSMTFLNPEPVSAIFLPVKSEQNTPLPLRLTVVGMDDILVEIVVDCITVIVFICFCFCIVLNFFLYKYSTKIKKIFLINK